MGVYRSVKILSSPRNLEFGESLFFSCYATMLPRNCRGLLQPSFQHAGQGVRPLRVSCERPDHG